MRLIMASAMSLEPWLPLMKIQDEDGIISPALAYGKFPLLLARQT